MTAEAVEAEGFGVTESRWTRWRTADRSTWLSRAVIVAAAAIAGLSYGWAPGSVPLEPYYEAAVRSMSTSWHDFFFGAFDPAGTVTVDKLPGALWLQALAVRAFGFHHWVIVLPQLVEGVLTVLILARAVRRLAGPLAASVAAVVMAASPATVALNRGNISDSLMILLLVLAADAVCAAIATGRQRTLLLAAFWVGLAFQAKMIEAWLVLPALGLAYLRSGPGSTARRARQLAVAGVVTAVVSLAWMAVVSVVPASHRPYVDGSGHNSEFAQVFVYNGFGRFGEQTPLQLLASHSGVTDTPPLPARGPARLLHGDLGRDVGWLVPAALIVGVGGLRRRRRRDRTDPLRAGFVLWGMWLLTLGATFSVATTINFYYTAALTPAVAAILGGGVALAWSERPESRDLRIALLAAVVVTAGYAVWLIPGDGVHRPGWLRPLAIAVGAVAVVVVAVTLVRRERRVLGAALAVAVAAALVVPVAASVGLVRHHEGAFDTPYESSTEAARLDQIFVTNPAQVAMISARLEQVQQGAPDLLATQSAAVASVFIDATGEETLPIGGFTGDGPSPTLAQVIADVRNGVFHLVVGAPSRDPRLEWVAAHCLHVGKPIGALHSYFCLPTSAG